MKRAGGTPFRGVQVGSVTVGDVGWRRPPDRGHRGRTLPS